MPTLRELQDAHDAATRALDEARGRLTQARQNAQNAHRDLVELERAAIDGNPDEAAIAAAKTKRVDTMRVLVDIRNELRG